MDGNAARSRCTTAFEYTQMVLPEFVRKFSPSRNQECAVPWKGALSVEVAVGTDRYSTTLAPAGPPASRSSPGAANAFVERKSPARVNRIAPVGDHTVRPA